MVQFHVSNFKNASQINFVLIKTILCDLILFLRRLQMNSRLSLCLLMSIILVSIYHLQQIKYIKNLENENQWLEKQIDDLLEKK